MTLFLIFIFLSTLHFFHLFFLLPPHLLTFHGSLYPFLSFILLFFLPFFFHYLLFFLPGTLFHFHSFTLSFISFFIHLLFLFFFFSFLFHGLITSIFFMLNLLWFLPLSFCFSSFPSFPFQSFLHYFTNVGLVQTSTNVSKYAKNLWLEPWKHENNRQWLILRYHHFLTYSLVRKKKVISEMEFLKWFFY